MLTFLVQCILSVIEFDVVVIDSKLDSVVLLVLDRNVKRTLPKVGYLIEL